MPARNHITPAEYHALHRLKSDYSVTELAGMFGRTTGFVQQYLDPYTKKRWRYCSQSELKTIVTALEEAKTMTDFINAVQFVGLPVQEVVTLWKHRNAYSTTFRAEIDRFGMYETRVIKLIAEAEAKRSPPPTPEPAPEPEPAQSCEICDDTRFKAAVANTLIDILGELATITTELVELNATQKVTLALFQELQNKGKGNGTGKQTTFEQQADYTTKKVEA